MKSTRQPTLAAILALSWLALQPGTVIPLVQSAFSAAHGHGHTVVLQADAGHVDLVLAHAERGHAAPAGDAGRPGPGASRSTGDHVVHLSGDPATREPARRFAPPEAALAAAAPLPLGRAAGRATAAWPRRHTRPAEPLRTIVLRL